MKTLSAIWSALARPVGLLLFCGFPFWTYGAETPSTPEYQIKAAFLYNFIKFVEWPPQVARETNAPIVIGILGQDPFGNDLESVIAGKRVNDRPIAIKRLGASSPEFCHVLFVSSSERRRLTQIFQELQLSPTLTVGDNLEGFCQAGGIINFVMEAKKVRFQIDNQAAERRGLKISSKLLRLAIPLGTETSVK